MAGVTVSFKDWRIRQKIKKITTDEAFGKFAAETAGKGMNPYVPMETGKLSTGFETAPWQVTYTRPYARHVYYGYGYNFSKEEHARATARWDLVWLVQKKRQFYRELAGFIARM